VNPSIVEYLSDRQCSRQWKSFLGALADEFSAQLDVGDLRALMHRVGVRFATQTVLERCQTVDDMQFAMSKIWVALDWGWVSVEEAADHLLITHNCAPLRAAFGPGALQWTPAFLEGVYQRWFQEQGSGTELVVVQHSQPDSAGCVEFRLGR
jgi:hypothetical protein